MANLKLKAKAIVAVRRRNLAKELEESIIQARESALESRLAATLAQRIPKDGKAGRDAPTLSEILSAIELPEPVIHHTETTVVQEVNPTDMEEFIKGLLPEMDQSLQPAVEQITIDVSDEKLEGFVSQEQMKEHLQKIQDAIFANQSGGGGSKGQLVNVIQVTEDTTITAKQLTVENYNVILIMSAGITVTLPLDDATKLTHVQQGFTGAGTYTIKKETS